MSTMAEEPAETVFDKFKLLEILVPLVKERVDAYMGAYVTKEYLDLKLAKLDLRFSETQTEMAKMENRLMTRLGGLMAVLIGLAVAVIKLTPNVPVPVALYAPPQMQVEAPLSTAPTPAPSLQTTR